ncbi:A24 family peptidase [Methanocaldococcus fervens]|uniref:Peptidase A24B, FlaK domain protein n=1 Tax=Methanocaldococcus fervens (strain DSM 4213 / JCM 15782 / AG86) TaxID=573064 RepID=C7P5U5_METFA|nr:A24 family peptidase [Methanocaldococcus fervens]ACV23927.1 Peptidase A24B, FlaK domain protein [Methanocaldococcus fervens AG86]
MDLSYLYGLICSIYGAVEDWKKREVSDFLWISMLWIGVILHSLHIKNLMLFFIEIVAILFITMAVKYEKFSKLFYIGGFLFLLTFVVFKSYFALSFLVFYLVGILLYYSNLMGGGDCKFLMGLSYLKGMVFTFIIFLNAILFVIPYCIIIFLINLKNKNYRGLRLKNLILLFIALKKDAKDVKKFETVMGNDKKISLIPKINEENEKIVYEGKVWVTPQLPFLVFICFSYVLYMFYPFPVILKIIELVVKSHF